MKITIILQDAPYGSEKMWNALRLTQALIREGARINIFLLGDAVVASKKGQETPAGFYNIQQMLSDIHSKGAVIKACMTCCKARGIGEKDLIDGIEIGKTVVDLSRWVMESDRVLTF